MTYLEAVKKANQLAEDMNHTVGTQQSVYLKEN